MKIAVDTAYLSSLASKAKDMLPELREAETHIRRSQAQLHNETCPAIQEQLAALLRETDTLTEDLSHISKDLCDIATLYGDKEQEITADIRALPYGADDPAQELPKVIVPVMPITPRILRTDQERHTAVRVIEPIPAKQLLPNWHTKRYLVLPESPAPESPEQDLLIEDWMKPLIVEAYANERI